MFASLAPTAARLRDGLHALAAAAATPLVPADYVELLAPMRARTDGLRARIVAVRPETPNAATIVLRPGPGWRAHVPGQYLRLGVDVDGVRHWRAYSLTSRPDEADGTISVTVTAIRDGIVSGHLVHHARPGELVRLEPATGDFTLPATPPERVLFVTAGSGLTPVLGMLRSHLDDLRDVVVVHSARSADDVLAGAELRALADGGRLRLIERHTATEGRLDVDQLHQLVPDLARRATWACGPAGLLDALEEHFAANDLLEALHVERFRSVIVEPGDGGTVTFLGTGRATETDGATSLLDAGEDAGVLMPSGCRMGICFGCVVPLRRGAVRDLRTGEVTVVADGDDVRVQTCISTAASACELDV
ncbi:ferredoxin reductase [Nitriliruptoraceae bacterium ZYF776]|nr:ferredoxin reductase [Profundirhabdus halotolerans]